MSNGVSFSLVVGAVCFVVYSNAPSDRYYNGGILWTININSTGAKAIHSKYYTGHDRNGIYYGDYKSNTSIGTDWDKPYIELMHQLLVYNGTNYDSFPGLLAYYDYSDSTSD